MGGMAEGDDAAGQRMADLVHTRPDRRLDIVAALGVGETLPATPRLHHTKPLESFDHS
jgi:hypothetical protein